MHYNFENNFNHHAPKEGQVAMYEYIRATLKAAAEELDTLCPDSREKSTAFTKLEEAMFWANASIARYEHVAPVPEHIVVENDDVLNFVYEKTGVDKNTIQKVFDAENDYLMDLGIVEGE